MYILNYSVTARSANKPIYKLILRSIKAAIRMIYREHYIRSFVSVTGTEKTEKFTFCTHLNLFVLPCVK